MVYYFLESYELADGPAGGVERRTSVKSISSFQITGMTISGFKCFDAPEHLVFGNPTVITGR